MSLIADKLKTQLSTEQRRQLISVGSSGAALAAQLSEGCPNIGVETLVYERERANRELAVSPLKLQPVLIDDIAVSGLTLSLARQAVQPQPETVALGMLYRSKTTRRRIGVENVRAALIYSRLGGGSPPINSVSTLLRNPERLNILAETYFNDCAKLFGSVLTGDRQ